MRLPRKLAILWAIALPMAGLAVPSAAHADSPCPELPSAQSFAWALDPNMYIRMTHGDFEDGGQTWNLTGGANVVSGLNETVMPVSPSDSHALNLPSGA